MFVCIDSRYDSSVKDHVVSILDTKDGVVEEYSLGDLKRLFGDRVISSIKNMTWDKYSNGTKEFNFKYDCFYAREKCLCFCMRSTSSGGRKIDEYAKLTVYQIMSKTKPVFEFYLDGEDYHHHFDFFNLIDFRDLSNTTMALTVKASAKMHGYLSKTLIFEHRGDNFRLIDSGRWDV